MISTSDYWEARYGGGGNSGCGSFGRLAAFKTEVINKFIRENNVSSVMDLGCGDGRIAKKINVPAYVGFDISSEALKLSRECCFEGEQKLFLPLELCGAHKAELGLSLDVIYHLLDEREFEDYIWKLFNCSTKFVCIYSSDSEAWNSVSNGSSHIKHRRFSEWIDKYASGGWELIDRIRNPYPFQGSHSSESFSDFYFYGRRF